MADPDVVRTSFHDSVGFPVRRRAAEASSVVDVAPGIQLTCSVSPSAYGHITLSVDRDAAAFWMDTSCVVDKRVKKVVINVNEPEPCPRALVEGDSKPAP